MIIIQVVIKMKLTININKEISKLELYRNLVK